MIYLILVVAVNFVHLELFFFTLYLFKIGEWINQANMITSLEFLVSDMGLTTLPAQVVSTLREKLLKESWNRKIICIWTFGQFFSKCTFLRLEFFFRLVRIQSAQFFSDSRYLKNFCIWWSTFLATGPLINNSCHGNHC